MTALAINGRFLAQRTTGVQRFATEVVRALAAQADRRKLRLLLPSDATNPFDLPATTGRQRGQSFEQFELPRLLRSDETLVGLGNTGPLALGARQAVVIHDAGAFDTPESYSTAFRLWYRGLQRGLAWRGAQLLTVSAFSRGRIAAALHVDPARVAVLPEGGEHILREPADAGVLARHGLKRLGFVLAVGTGAVHKNLGALGAVAALCAERDLVLGIAGATDAAVFQAAGLPAGIRPLGRVSDAELRALYEAALCLVFPSRYEGFGLPPLEAMMCGCPVVAAQAGAVPEVCGHAALWFDPAQPAGAAAAIARLVDEPGLREALVTAGHDRAARYTWDAAATALLGALA